MAETDLKTDAPATQAVLKQGGLWAPVRYFVARMDEGEVLQVAASLSFTTILQIVPAMALLLAVLTAFPAFQTLRITVQNFLLRNLVPDTGMKMNEQFIMFLDAAGQLTAFGVVGLAVTTILLLLTIETSFNIIFKVIRMRPLRTRLLVLWAVITVGPVLLGLSSTLANTFGTFGTAEGGTELSAGLPPALAALLSIVVPTVLTWLALTFIYTVVPNRKVSLPDAVIGAAIAAVMLAGLRYGFGVYVRSMTSYEAVYGALAAVPVFLVWIYAIWIVIMAGAVITASLPDWRYSRKGGVDSPVGRLGLALEILAKLAAAQEEGRAVSGHMLAKELDVPDVVLMRVLDSLRQGRVAATTDDGMWMLSRDLDRVALADVVHLFGLGLDYPLIFSHLPDRQTEMTRRLCHHLNRAAESERATLSVTLAKIISVPDEHSSPEGMIRESAG